MTFGAKFYHEDGYLQLDADSEPAELISFGYVNTQAEYIGNVDTGYLGYVAHNPEYAWDIHHPLYIPDNLTVRDEAPMVFCSCDVPVGIIQVKDDGTGMKKIGFITNTPTKVNFWIFGKKKPSYVKPDWGMVIYREDGTVGWTSEQKTLKVVSSSVTQKDEPITLTPGRKYAVATSNASVFMSIGPRIQDSEKRADYMWIPGMKVIDNVVIPTPVKWAALQVGRKDEYVFPKVLDWPNTVATIIDVTEFGGF
jgi:hypothetical protein